MSVVSVAQVESLLDTDLAELCDAAEVAILDGGGFGWLSPPPREAMERFWRGVMEAQSSIATITSNFVAPWARGHGMARDLTVACEDAAREKGVRFINLDVRDTQEAAIQLYESLGYKRWGTNPNYAFVEGRAVSGFYYTKGLRGRGKPRADKA
jgi:ribosomal protein S18 acetylase RimI-like enzyme